MDREEEARGARGPGAGAEPEREHAGQARRERVQDHVAEVESGRPVLPDEPLRVEASDR